MLAWLAAELHFTAAELLAMDDTDVGFWREALAELAHEREHA